MLDYLIPNFFSHALLANWGPHTKFETITFLVRDEDKRKLTIMTAELISGNGVLVRNAAGKQVMLVRLPTNDPTSFGKLMHPAPATLFKVGGGFLNCNIIINKYFLN